MRARIPNSEFLIPNSEHFRRERDDLHEPALAELAGDRAEHARADRLVVVVDEHGRVAIESDVAAVTAALLLDGPHDDGLDDLALLHGAFGRRLFHRRGDDVAEPRVPAGRSANRVDDGNLARAGIVGDIQDGAHLNHGCFSEGRWVWWGGWVLTCPTRPTCSARTLDFHRLPHDTLERPALAAALRARLDDLHHVTRLRFVLLVVDHELRRAPLGLPVEPVPHLPLDGNHDALLHLVAHDDAGLFRLLAHKSSVPGVSGGSGAF